MSVNQSLSSDRYFQTNLAFGQQGETRIVRWLRSRGWYVMPAYDIEYVTGKGPRVFGPKGVQLVAPDLLAWRADKQIWFEAKHKKVFTWWRKKKIWETGIDKHHWYQYQQVAERTNVDLWVLFLHVISEPDPRDKRYGCPALCPIGLFGERISFLIDNVSHQHSGWGPHGMVYWAAPNQRDGSYQLVPGLRLIASLMEIPP